MPIQKYNDLNEAFQALTDLEIVEDSNNFPIAKIKVPKLHEITIQMLSEYDYFYHLCPMREYFLNYWATHISMTKDNITQDKLIEKIQTIVSDIESIKTKKDFVTRSASLAYLFEDMKIRYYFFKQLKKMKIIKWYVSWKKYQKIVRPIDTITIFVYLWLFNFDGVKKNAKILLARIGLGMNSQSPIIYNNSSNWELYKKQLAQAHKRLQEHLNN
jgi:hypothetical protein